MNIYCSLKCIFPINQTLRIKNIFSYQLRTTNKVEFTRSDINNVSNIVSGAGRRGWDEILTNFMSHNCQFKLAVLHNNNPNYIVIWLWLTFTLLMNNFHSTHTKNMRTLQFGWRFRFQIKDFNKALEAPELTMSLFQSVIHHQNLKLKR